MAKIHSKNVAFTLDGTSLSGYSNSITFTRTADSHDTTTFGQDAKTYQTGLLDATASVEGFYDSTAMTGPAALFRAIMAAGDSVELVYTPEGSTTGKPEATVQVIVTSYEESSAVADMVMFSADLQCTGDITDGTA
jgi:hypothetical protein